jgi:hypothetical protein
MANPAESLRLGCFISEIMPDAMMGKAGINQSHLTIQA